MTQRVWIERVVRQAGYVDIEAASKKEAKECVQRWAKVKGSPLAPTWTEDMPKGAIEVTGVEEL